MSRNVYDKGREKFLDGKISWTTDTIKAVLVSDAYTLDLEEDEFLADIPAPARIAITAALTSKTITAGVAGAADTVWPDVTNANQGVGVVTFKDTGDPATSPLIHHTSDSSAGLPVIPNGGDINCKWDTDPDVLIFKL